MPYSGKLKFSAIIIFIILLGGALATSQQQSAFAASGNTAALGVTPHPNNAAINSKQIVHPLSGVPYSLGDVFVGAGSGKIKHFDSSGNLLDTLDSTTGVPEDTGMCFDSSGNLYATTFIGGKVSKFDSTGTLSTASFASGLDTDPESCAMDKSSHMYVGDADGSALIYKYDLAGNQLDSYSVNKDARGTDWIDLAADQCTIHYTSEGSRVMAYNVCTKTQLPDFATGLPAPCYAHRITSDGGELVACKTAVVKLDNTGAITKTYPAPNSGDYLFALNLDPDGTTFWTASIASPFNVYRVNIASGAVVTTFDPAPFNDVAGLAIFGEKAQGCGDNCGGGTNPVGGMGIPIDSTALLLAGVQGSALWMIPAIVIAGAGIGFVSLRRSKKQN